MSAFLAVVVICRTFKGVESKQRGIYYVAGMTMKCYFKVSRPFLLPSRPVPLLQSLVLHADRVAPCLFSISRTSQVNRPTLCKNIIRAIGSSSNPQPFETYPIGHRVTWRYYMGMLAFLEEDYSKVSHVSVRASCRCGLREGLRSETRVVASLEPAFSSSFLLCQFETDLRSLSPASFASPQAEDHLLWAFANCHHGATRNLQQILHYLLPLRLLLGKLPSPRLLALFPSLSQVYTPFLDAIRKADLKGYDEAMARGQKRLVEGGVWLILERGREVVVRGVFKDV